MTLCKRKAVAMGDADLDSASRATSRARLQGLVDEDAPHVDADSIHASSTSLARPGRSVFGEVIESDSAIEPSSGPTLPDVTRHFSEPIKPKTRMEDYENETLPLGPDGLPESDADDDFDASGDQATGNAPSPKPQPPNDGQSEQAPQRQIRQDTSYSPFARVVELYLGDRRYYVHFEHLVKNSEVFAKAFAPDKAWHNGDTNQYNLDDEDTGIEMFLQFIYSNRLRVTHSTTELDLMAAYVFGDKYLCAKLKTAAMDAIIERKRKRRAVRVDWAAVRFAYDNLPEGDTMLSLLVQCFCLKIRRSDHKPDMSKLPGGSLPAAFLEDAMNAMMRGDPEDIKFPLSLGWSELCKTFHDHEGDEIATCGEVEQRVDFGLY